MDAAIARNIRFFFLFIWIYSFDDYPIYVINHVINAVSDLEVE